MDEIVNKVQGSGLISLDLAKYNPIIEYLEIDLLDQLWEGLVLREKDFRLWIKEHDWQVYSNKGVNVTCSSDAIIPTWAYMLVASRLEDVGGKYIIGSKLDLEKFLIKELIQYDDLEAYRDGRIIIKGCSDISCPEFAMSELVRKLQPVAKSIMYGEPCSTVPVFKKK